MSLTRRARGVASLAAVGLALVASGCSDGGPTSACVPVAPRLRTSQRIALAEPAIDAVDLLVVVENAASMAPYQHTFMQGFDRLLAQLQDAQVDPVTMRPRYAPPRSLHVGVVSSDLGTPGSVVPSCSNSDLGDDGLLNPIKSGLSLRTHLPWTTAPAGRRPPRCTDDPNQYPSFLTFTADVSNATEFRDDFVCNAYLSIGGCGLPAHLEAAYRALVTHNPRQMTGNIDPNAGFVRDDAALAILVLANRDDGSTRDCRFAEPGVPCTDAVGVYDVMSPDWSSSELNLRFYMYTPGSRQDPTWPIDRYIDPMRPNRGFTSLKPGRPELVFFGAIAGVPLDTPLRGVDWDRLLGRNPDGSDGYTGESAEGPVSMRQRNMDPMCSGRVVPSCRAEASPRSGACDSQSQPFAWPARRIAQVARRFDERYGNGMISSVCRQDFGDAFTEFARLVRARLRGPCLAGPLPTEPACAAGQRPTAARPCTAAGMSPRVECVVREALTGGQSPTEACTAARGRTPGGYDDALHLQTCIVQQVSAPVGGAPPAGQEGFYYDASPDPSDPLCTQRIRFTAGATPRDAYALLDCVEIAATGTVSPGATCGGPGRIGGSCTPIRPGGATSCDRTSSAGCFLATRLYVESDSRACASGTCLVNRYDERSDPLGAARSSFTYCSCRCAVADDLRSIVPPSELCACPERYACLPVAQAPWFPTNVRGSYCVRNAP